MKSVGVYEIVRRGRCSSLQREKKWSHWLWLVSSTMSLARERILLQEPIIYHS